VGARSGAAVRPANSPVDQALGASLGGDA